jgi:hypothetical protein
MVLDSQIVDPVLLVVAIQNDHRSLGCDVALWGFSGKVEIQIV